MSERLHLSKSGLPNISAPKRAAPQGDNSQAKTLALQCLADAKAKRISAAEIGESIDDLTEFMAGAIAEANEREAHRLTEKND